MLAELRTLVAIARWGTFTETGNRVGLTQAAVSGQMKRLEDQLGFSLFDRTGRSATLNPAGARTVDLAKPILDAVDALSDPAKHEPAHPLKIGSIASTQPTIVTQALRLFRGRFENVRVHIVPGVSLHLLDQVDAGELDVAIIIQPPFGLSGEFVWQPLCREPYSLLVPFAHRKASWQELLQTMPLLRYDRSSFGGRQVDRYLKALPLSVNDAIEVDDLSAMIAMVRSGMGVAIAPLSSSLLPLPAEVHVIALPGEPMFREIGFVRATRPPGTTAIHSFGECLIEASMLYSGEPGAV